MRRFLTALVALLLVVSLPVFGQDSTFSFRVRAPKVALSGVPFDLRVEVAAGLGDTGAVTLQVDGLQRVVDGQRRPVLALTVTDGSAVVKDAVMYGAGTRMIRFLGDRMKAAVRVVVLPGILSVLPPILAIVLALLTRQVLVALFFGTWLGVTFLQGYNPLLGLLRSLDTYLIDALADPDHAAIVMFSMTLGGMVGVISRAGGTQGIVQAISRFAKGPRGAQLASWALGVFIFFDDYANTLVVGNTMRPFTDRMRVSREKLSYIVDSTAAPVASVALISTWVGFQVGLIDSAFDAIDYPADAYVTFLRSIPFSAYSLLAIFFVALVALSLRDFGPMWNAEHRSVTTGKVLRDGAQPISDAASLDGVASGDVPLRWWNAFVPILTMIAVTLVGLYLSGRAELGQAAKTARVGEIFGAADSFDVLMWASFAAAITAIVLAVSQRILTLAHAIEAWLSGVRAMVLAVVILVLAWSIGKVCADLHTADYVIHLARRILSPHLLPAVTFVVAAFVSFATGTSWATMAILVPIVVPMAHKLAVSSGLEPAIAQTVLLGTIGSVLSGSVFGDHCSPISDTTIMSSMASAADHVDHVRTQMPYAILVAGIALATCYIPDGFGFSPLLGLSLGAGLLLLAIRFLGKPIAERDALRKE